MKKLLILVSLLLVDTGRAEMSDPTAVGAAVEAPARVVVAAAGGLRLSAAVENTSKTEFAPERLPLLLGIDTYMSEYPRWNEQFFPTFLRCENSSFWGYMMTPHGRVLGIASPDPANPRWGRAVETVTCEDYIGTIGEWWSPTNKGDGYLDREEWGWTGDGIPYEIFKAMEEIVLAHAFVLERAGGTFIGYNCRVSLNGKSLEVVPAEAIVQRVHVNLKTPRHMHVRFASETVSANCRGGMQWITTKKPWMPYH